MQKVEIKKEGIIQQRQRDEIEERFVGEVVVERTARYYDKMKKSILNSIMPSLERSKSKLELRST